MIVDKVFIYGKIMNYKESILEIIKNIDIDKINFDGVQLHSIRTNKEYYKEFSNSFPNVFTNIGEFIYVSKIKRDNKTYDIMFCPVCGNKNNYSSNGYKICCSQECSHKYNKRKEKFSNTYKNKTLEEKELIKNKRKQTNLDKYGVVTNLQNEQAITNRINKYNSNSPFSSKTIKEKANTTIKTKFNVDNVFQSKEIQEKIKKTNINKYGCEYANQSNIVKEKIIKTNLERYNVEYVLQSESIKNKAKETNIKKYGKEYPSQSNIVKEKTIKTCKEKYGSNYFLGTEACLMKTEQTCMEKYNVPYNCMRPEARNHKTISNINKQWKELLDVSEIEFVIDKYSYDLKKDTTLIEINPTITHNSTFCIFNREPLDKNYHYNKSKVAMDNNYFCFHIWDWDDKTKIINHFKDKQKLYARKCVVKEVNVQDCNDFLNTYHFQNTCKGQNIRLGLYYNDALVQLMTFGKPRYNKNYEYELLRLCTNASYIVIGGSEKLFKYFLATTLPESVISYCDNAKFSGNVYKKLSFELEFYNKPSKHWYNIKTKRHITDNLLRWRGFSQLHGDNEYALGNKGDDNTKLMIDNGYVEIYDCGQSTYIWKQPAQSNL